MSTLALKNDANTATTSIVANPTANITLTVPDETGTLATRGSNTFSGGQRTGIYSGANAVDFTLQNNIALTATSANVTVGNATGCTGQSGVITITTCENITGWGTNFKFQTVPTGLTGVRRFGYFVESPTSVVIGLVQ